MPGTTLTDRSLAIAQCVDHLQQVLGQVVTAAIAGVEDAGKVDAWVSGSSRPRPEEERRLRVAYEIVQSLESVEDRETIRAWFIGMNPELDDRAPALVIAGDADSDLVMQAASIFATHG